MSRSPNLKYLLFMFTLILLGLKSSIPNTSLLSSKVSIAKLIENKKMKAFGPNCWNGALIKAGLIQSVRYVSKGEYWFWMNSPYCKELDPLTPPQPGDLGSIFWAEKGHYHSFVYVNGSKVFSKNSPDPKFEYKYQNFEDMFNPENRSMAQKCRNQRTLDTNPNCYFQIKYHRCQPVSNNFYTQDPVLKKLDEKLKKLEQFVLDWTSGTSNLSPSDYGYKIIGDLYNILLEVKDKRSFYANSPLRIPWEAIYFRTQGLILSDIELARRNSKVFPVLKYVYNLQKSTVNKPHKQMRDSVDLGI